MKRREFIASTGTAAGFFSTGGSAGNAASVSLNPAKLQQIEIAIKGSFGAGFSLESAEQSNWRVTAVIEHNENYLKVASSDLTDWSILCATDM